MKFPWPPCVSGVCLALLSLYDGCLQVWGRSHSPSLCIYAAQSSCHAAVHLVLQIVSSPSPENNPLLSAYPPQQPSLLLPHSPATVLWTILSVQNPQNPGPAPLCLVFSWFHCNRSPYTDFLAYDAKGSTIFALSLWLLRPSALANRSLLADIKRIIPGTPVQESYHTFERNTEVCLAVMGFISTVWSRWGRIWM